MIQRIQTIWFLLASAAAFLTLKLSFFSGNKIGADNGKQFVQFNAMSNIPLMILTVSVAIASLVLIFLYKDRKMQQKITAAVLAVSVLNVVLYFLHMKDFIPNEVTFDLSSVLSFAVPVFLILAFRGIYKDQKLLRSVDRLR